VSTSLKTFPTWAVFSLVTNGILILAVTLLLLREQGLTAFLENVSAPSTLNYAAQNAVVTTTKIRDEPLSGKRRKLNYQQWLDVLKQEAEVAGSNQNQNLNILLGDSISLWFPTDLLPGDNKTWLNQAISGETSAGILKRLNLFDKNQPQSIFIMIGINDLIRGVDDTQVLENYRQIVDYLRRQHPKTEIVVQSILPHGAEEATWEGKDKLVKISNHRIRQLNAELQIIANKAGAKYLDLNRLFTNEEGNLLSDFTTDGLHLSHEGYIVWRSALKMFEI
jgi:lysophospholipase L1-like esterase